MCFQKQKIEIWIFWKITCLGHLNFQIIYIPNQRINILSLPSSYFSPAGLILTLLCLCFYTWNLWRLPLILSPFSLKSNSLHEKRAEILLSALGFCLTFGFSWIPTKMAVSSRFSGNRQRLVGISIVYCLLTVSFAALLPFLREAY